MQWLTLTKPHMKKIVVANIYRPPSGSVGNFTDSLYACFDALSKYKEHDIFLLGDMNIDMNKQHNNITLLKNFIKQTGMKQLIKEPTHFNRLSPDSLLDIIITNSTSITNSGTKNVNISDHEMMLCTRRHIPKVKQQATFTGRSYREYNRDVFQNSLRNENWDDFL